jgi:hypothetical protein
MGPLGFQGLDDCARVTEDPSASFRLIAMKGRSWIIVPATWAFTTGSTWPARPRANPQEVSP